MIWSVATGKAQDVPSFTPTIYGSIVQLYWLRFGNVHAMIFITADAWLGCWTQVEVRNELTS